MNKKGSMAWILLGAVIAFAGLYITLSMIDSTTKPSEGLIESAQDLVDQAVLQGFSYELRSDGSLTFSSGITETRVAAAPATPLSGSIAEKAVKAASEAGLSRADAEIVLKLISQESGFKHCCAVSGKNTAASPCAASAEETCGEDKILTSGGALAGAGTSKGAMQLNSGAHPAWFTDKESTLCLEPKYKLDCLIKQNAGCMGKTAFQMDCNIRLGVRYLMWAKTAFGKGKHYACTTPDKPGLPGCNFDVTYYGWDAALRTYNGWGCPKDNLQCRYVDHVNAKDVSSYKSVLDAAYS